MMWKQISPSVRDSILFLLALSAAVAFYFGGYQIAEKTAQAEKNEIINTYQAAALATERLYTEKLKQAEAEKQKWIDFAQAQSKQLAETSQELDKAHAKLQENVKDVVQKDGKNFNGIGSDSVQLYNRSHGYAD